MRFSRADDRPRLSGAGRQSSPEPSLSLEAKADRESAERLISAARHLDLAPLLGHWKNTNEQTRGIVDLTAAASGDQLILRVTAAASNGLREWGEVRAAAFADDVDSALGANFHACCDFGFMITHLQGYIRQGVLVIMSFNVFNDASGRSNYVSKEFFFREAAWRPEAY